MPFSKLLIGFAFSPNLKANVFEASRIAVQFDAEILFLHVGEKTQKKESDFKELLNSVPDAPKKQEVLWKMGSPEKRILNTFVEKKVYLL